MKSFLTPANDAIARLKKNIETFDRMIETTMKDAFQYRLDGAKTDADRIKMMQDRSAKLMKESGLVSNNGMFNFAGVNDLQKSYSKVTEAIRLQADAKRSEIERYNQLAHAEREANRKTLDLIRNMDKLGETAVDAVDAYSTEAVKLQSRSFIEMPKVNFSQNAENDLGTAQQGLREIYANAARIAEAFMKEGERRKTADEATQKGLEERILKTFELVQQRIKDLNTEYDNERKDIFNKMQEYEQKSAESLKKLEENSTAAKTSTEQYQKNAENHLKTIADNTQTFRELQKATI